jgi:hypothetical protein
MDKKQRNDTATDKPEEEPTTEKNAMELDENEEEKKKNEKPVFIHGISDANSAILIK